MIPSGSLGAGGCGSSANAMNGTTAIIHKTDLSIRFSIANMFYWQSSVEKMTSG
jgi:hypothetical protein